MYLEVKTGGYVIKNAVEVPTNLLTRNNQLHVVRDATVHLVQVIPERFLDETVIVSGLDGKTTIISEQIGKPIQGTKIKPVKAQ